MFFGGSFSSFEHAAIYGGGGMTWDADDFNVPVQQHSLAWIEHGLPFVGAVRFSGSGGVAPTVTDGTFVSNSGFVYRIAGGAPIYVSSWNAVGGPQPTTALSNAQFAALPQYPADGSLISSTATGMVYEIAGGAPLYVSNWNAIGGARPSVGVDQAAIDNADGGTPWNHLHRYPADGSLISSTATGMVYEIAGGAPLYVSNWNAIGGARPSVGVDQAAIDNADGGTPWNHLHRYPADRVVDLEHGNRDGVRDRGRGSVVREQLECDRWCAAVCRGGSGGDRQRRWWDAVESPPPVSGRWVVDLEHGNRDGVRDRGRGSVVREQLECDRWCAAVCRGGSGGDRQRRWWDAVESPPPVSGRRNLRQ